ncbi:MAG: alpha/beta fold hydrolase [Candidatus Dojkabacteria bacterium]
MDDLTVDTIFFDYENNPIEILTLSGEHNEKDFIFLNGIASPVQNCINLLTEIADRGYNVWAINMPGHGKSGMMHDVTWDLMQDILTKIIKSYDIKKPVLGGFSMGGALALRYFSEFPDQVDSVRLLSPLCYDLPSIHELVMNGVKFSLKFAKDYWDNSEGKELPAHIYPYYYLRNYSQTLFSGAIDPAKFKKLGHRIHIVVSYDDEIIEQERVRKAIRKIHGVTLDALHGFTHEMYYSTKETISEIVDNLLK